MSKISKEGYEQITVIKNALDSMYDTLSGTTFYVKNGSFIEMVVFYFRILFFNFRTI